MIKKAINKKVKKNLATAVIVVALLAISFCFSDPIVNTIGKMKSAITGVPSISENIDGSCQVHFINVGQGDASLIMVDGYNILIDGGDNACEGNLVKYLEKCKVEQLDMVIATHPHADHIGGLDSVLESFETKLILMPKLRDEIIPSTKSYNDFLNVIIEKEIEVKYAEVSDVYTFGNAVITVFAPFIEFDDLNNSSIGVKLEYGSKSFIFTGDMEKKAENIALLAEAVDFEVDVLKVAHHGSKTSTSKEFFNAVNPKYCVVSLKEGNSYGFPHKETLKTIGESDAKVYYTAISGDIVFSVENNEFVVVTSID